MSVAEQLHTTKVAALRETLARAYPGRQPIRLQRTSTNSTRDQSSGSADIVSVDLSCFNEVLNIDTRHQWVDVEPGVPMDKLVTATIAKGLIPPVLPEFPGITVGGAVQGGALESSSFKYGQFNDTVLEYELVLTDGTVLTATPHNEYADLYWGISTSYGSLAIVTRVRLPLLSSATYVRLTITPFDSAQACADGVLAAAEGSSDFVEGLVFSEELRAVITGTLENTKSSRITRFGRNVDAWYYRFIRQAVSQPQRTVSVPLRDYLFRYDKGAFWMGEFLFPIFHLQSTPVTRFFFSPFMRTRKLYDGLHALNIQHEYVIQDFYMPKSTVGSLLNYNATKSKIYPLWLCPIKASVAPQKLSSHYNDSSPMLLNIGMYGVSKHSNAIETTRELELLAISLGGRKMLYAQTYLPEKEFWSHYDYLWYSQIRTKYRAEGLKDLWTKIYSGGTTPVPRKLGGLSQMFVESLQGKNIVWK
jgi:Delta24-sterol reductase